MMLVGSTAAEKVRVMVALLAIFVSPLLGVEETRLKLVCAVLLEEVVKVVLAVGTASSFASKRPEMVAV